MSDNNAQANNDWEDDDPQEEEAHYDAHVEKFEIAIISYEFIFPISTLVK